jgi:hypothetical protein
MNQLPASRFQLPAKPFGLSVERPVKYLIINGFELVAGSWKLAAYL